MHSLKSPVRVLYLEDSDADAELVRRRLADEGIILEVTRVIKRQTYLEALEQGCFDLILSDYSMPGFDGGSALALAKEKCPQTPFVFVSGTIGEEVAIESLKNGATNYVLKDRIERLAPAVRGAMEESATQERLRASEKVSLERTEFFRQISENVTDLVAVLDLEGRRLYTSPSYQALFGKEPLHGTTAFADIHPDDRQRIQHLFQETVKTGIAQQAEFRFLLKDGNIRYIESQGGVIRDRDGRITGVIVVSRDVSKRKQAEEDLKASEERFHSVVQTASDAIVLADSKGNIIAWNSAAQRVFGYAELEVRGKPLTLLLPERYRERHQPGCGLTGAADASRFIAVAVELHGLRKDGTEFPLELSLSAWKTGEAVFYSAILHDITERHSTRQTLAQLRRQNELLLDAAGEGICGVDQQGKITFINPAAARMLGYFVDELIGRPLHQAVQNTKSNQNSHVPGGFPIYATLKDGTVHRLSDTKFWRKDGTSFPVEYVSTPMRDKGECIGAVVVFKDVTDRRCVEEQLRKQAALLDNATDVICAIDMDAHIVYWNKSAERLYGWAASEAIGKVAHDLLFKVDSPRPDQAFKCLIKNGEWKGELNQVTRTGQEIVVQSRWTLMHDSHGTAESILVINTDITEKKALEAQFLRAQRLESIGRLAGGIAHDLNNVLTPILMTAQLLGPKLKDQADQKMLETIETSARRGADMVRQILSFSRGTDAKEGLVHLKDLISEEVKIAKQTFPPSIALRSRISKDLWAVMGNGTQLFQVLMNLCVNARDAMPDGGTLLIEADNVVLDAEYVRLHPPAQPGPHVVVIVSDTGTGIPPEIIHKIFNSFFTTKNLGKGTGLGLSSLLTIVKNHRGHVWVESEVGKGTRFKIYLPASDKIGAQPERTPTADLPRGNGQWVLVVDDEETIREITTATLEHFGYHVLAASDGTEAVARYARYKDRISLVVADMVMPFMDGPGLIHALKRMNPAVKVLAMSGQMEDRKLDSLISKNNILFLPKPFSSEKLLINVHKLLLRGRPANKNK